MSSNALVGASSGSNFAQQGAVDWVALSKSNFSFSVEVLSRFSKAGVELITVAIGQAIFSSLDVPAEGQKRLHDAISKLKAFASYGDVLWFGFGIKHITRILCETEQGATCVAICACLSVSYDTSFASQVLKASTDLTKAPGSLTPALSQWGALMAVCAGAVTDSQFPALVEGFSRLIGGTSQGCDQQPLHTPTTATALAGAIQELSKVSNGTLQSVTFQGGVDCGWLAAVAQWLLCLRVEICDVDGDLLHSNFSRIDHRSQVTVIQQLGLVGDVEGTFVSRRSYFVPSGSLCFGLNDHNALDGAQFVHLFAYGRAEWDNIIQKSFGSAADELLHPKHIKNFAMFLCSGFSESSQWSELRMEGLNSSGETYLTSFYERRRAFMEFASMRLPELADVAAFAKHERYNPQRNFKYYLKSICPCKDCSTQSASRRSLFCLHRVGAVIYKYLWTLSWLDIDPSVKPSSSGLRLMYYTRAYGDEDLELIKSHFWQYGLDTSLFPMFTGTSCEERTTEGVSATTQNGICIYYSSLQDPNESPSQIVRLRVVLGHIEKDGTLYRKIRDRKFVRNEAKCYSFLPLSVLKLGPQTRLLLIADETLDSRSLEASFYIESKPILIASKGRFSHSHIQFDPANGSGALSKEMFGVCELRNNIMKRIGYFTDPRLSIQMSKITEPTTPCRFGRCTKVTQAVFKDQDQEFQASLPEQGEWMLSGISRSQQSNGLGRCCITIVRANFPLLYSILSYLDRTSDTSLLYVRPSYTCSGEYHDRENAFCSDTTSTERYSGPVSVYSMKESNPVIFELLSDSNADLTTSPSNIPEIFSPPTIYSNKTKKELEILLRQKGISFKRTSRKHALIRQIEEYDAQNHPANLEDEMQEHSQEERPDVEMSEDIYSAA